MKLIYTLAFLFDQTDWKLKSTPSEILEAIKTKKSGKALDLGCGEGEHAVAIAKEGWQVTGVDFVHKAIRKAKAIADRESVSDRTNFLVGDVVKLDALNLSKFDFAFDLGCFHLLNDADQQAYISGVAGLLKKDAVLLLYAFTPRRQGRREVGYSQENLSDKFSRYFNLKKYSEKSYWRFPAAWYWFQRK